MREIKFRAWDIREAKMYANPIVINGRFYTDEFHREIDISDLDVGKQVLMQFTVLKDKNGKDIYESDILLHYKNYLTVQAKMETSCGCCDVVFGWSFGNICIDYEKNMIDGVAVVGNIWENPELVK